MMDAYLAPWIVSNTTALILLFFCWKYPRIGRYLYSVIFLIACIVNVVTLIQIPEVYLDYGPLAFSDFYESIISGIFAENLRLIVSVIAFGQLAISLGIFFGGAFYRPALIFAMIFSIAITPLGIGAAFPVPLIMLISLLILYSKKHFARSNTVIT